MDSSGVYLDISMGGHDSGEGLDSWPCSRTLPSTCLDASFSVSAFSFLSSTLSPTPQAMGSQGNLSAEVEQATRRQVQGMQSSQQRNRECVLAQLLGMVCDVRPQVHPNYRIAA